MPSLHREFIIELYRSLVKAHGGKVIAERVFIRESGVSRRYWQGVHWRKWSALQAEAGFEPNPRMARIPDEYLLRRFAELALQLKRLPTEPDLKLWRKQDPSFPSYAAFDRVWRREELLIKLEAYLEGKPEFAPVAALLEQRRAQFMARHRSHRRVRGFVYLVHFGEPAQMTFQIGREHGGRKRLQSLGARLRRFPGAVHVIDTDDPVGIERYWRMRFRPQRLRRNCYRLLPQDILAFRLRRFQ